MLEGTPTKRPWAVRLALLAAFLLFAATATIIYYRFITTPATDCNIFVIGNRNLQDAVVTVERIADAQVRSSPLKVTLSANNRYVARFFLSSGTFRVQMVRADGVVIINDEPFVPPGRYCTYDIARLYPEKPSSRPAAPAQ